MAIPRPNVLVSFRQLHKATIPSHRKTQSRKSAQATRAPKLILNTKSLEILVVKVKKGTHLRGEYHHERLEMGYVHSRRERKENLSILKLMQISLYAVLTVML